jgi:ribose transport system ATP-binding protein
MIEAGAAVTIESASKTFGDQRVLDAVDVTFSPGEVHALLGENGSGKSTLIKILSGFYVADPGGSVQVGGQELEGGSPRHSYEAGLRFVHQHLAIIPEFNAVENMALELGYGRPKFIDWKAQAQQTQTLLARLNVDMDIWRPLSECRAVERSAVSIARAIATDRGRVNAVFLDEPTSALPEPEVQQLFRVIRELTKSGVAVVCVTHRLDEVFEIADRVTVLRDGRCQGTVARADLTRDGLVEMIVGRAVVRGGAPPVARAVPPAQPGTGLLDVADLAVEDHFSGLSFRLEEGEILGVVGLAGSGHEYVARALVGGADVSEGTVRARGEAISPLSPQHALRHGVVLGLSNTQVGSALKDFSLGENITVASLGKYRRRFGPLRSRRERRDAAHWIADLDVRPADPERPYALLSGGNQQKAILGKCLNTSPSVLVLDDPTAGVDVGAREAIYERIAQEAARGMGVVVCSNDLEDVISTCRRVIVFRQGRPTAELHGELDERQLLSIAAQSNDVQIRKESQV